MPRSLQERYDDALQTIASQARLILDLRELADQQEATVAELEERAEPPSIIAELGPWEQLDYDPEELYYFLEDIGFDPYNLPSSVGERRDIYDLVQAARKVR